MSTRKANKADPIEDVDLEALLKDIENPTTDPLESAAVTGDLDQDAKEEVSAMLSAFQKKGKEEEARFRNATDSEYWFCVCFQNREQKEALLKALGWFEHGDKYLDGKFVAKSLGVKLPEVTLKFQGQKVNKKILAHVGIVGKRKVGDSK
jgi:hypothetical protein